MERKIPTLLGLVLVFLIVGVIALLVEQAGRQSVGANPSLTPERIAITNVTDTSFTVTWTTDQATTGIASVSGPKKKNETFFDERDQKNKLTAYTTHSVIVSGRDSSTAYEITLVVNGEIYKDQHNPVRATTAPHIAPGPGTLNPTNGIILYAQNQPAKDTLVFASLEGGQLLSTLVMASGNWFIPLANSRTTDLSRFILPAERITLLIRAYDGKDETTAITDTLNSAPVPTMTMGKTYDFRKIQAKKTTPLAAASTETPAVLGTQTNEVTLATPPNGAALTTNLPLVSGTGIPGKTVAVVLGITNPIGGQTTVGSDGIWRFTPTGALGEGNQSVTITTTDKNGKPTALTHTFTIFKSGTQVLGDATPSATLTPTPVATVSATPTPTAMPTAQPIPESGTTMPTYLLLFAAVGLISTGFVLARAR